MMLETHMNRILPLSRIVCDFRNQKETEIKYTDIIDSADRFNWAVGSLEALIPRWRPISNLRIVYTVFTEKENLKLT